MAEQQPTDRLAYSGDLEPVIDRLCVAYGVGTPAGSSVIEVGYEDCNVVVETDQNKYLAKMFAKTRTAEEIARYTTTMQKVIEAGVHHPELLTTSSGEIAYTDSGITLVLMRFVEGKTFFELDQVPDAEERKAVLEQAAKVNGIDYKPTYLFDSWTRKISIAVLTYLVVVAYLHFVIHINPWLNALVPVVGFLISTFTVSYLKKLWIEKRERNE